MRILVLSDFHGRRVAFLETANKANKFGAELIVVAETKPGWDS